MLDDAPLSSLERTALPAAAAVIGKAFPANLRTHIHLSFVIRSPPYILLSPFFGSGLFFPPLHVLLLFFSCFALFTPFLLCLAPQQERPRKFLQPCASQWRKQSRMKR